MEYRNLSFALFTVLWFWIVLQLIKTVGSAQIQSGKDFETRRLYFAAVILTGLGLIFIFSTGLYYLSDAEGSPGKEIFDATKTIIPPIITLVLGYYFGQEKRQADENSAPPDKVVEKEKDEETSKKNDGPKSQSRP